MNPEGIAAVLTENGYRVALADGGKKLTVAIEAGEQALTLEHVFPDRLERLPSFSLRDPPPLGTLAHVVPDTNTALGSICVEDRDSVSINYDVPSAVYAESVSRHVRLLKRLIEDPEWNRAELLREFHSHWAFLCDLVETVTPVIYFFGSGSQGTLQVKLPREKAGTGLTGNYLALPQEQATDKAFETLRNAVSWHHRTTVGKAITLHLNETEPAPGSPDGVIGWYLQALDHLDSASSEALRRFRKHPGKEIWLLFSVDIANGRAWVALQFQSKRKAKLPVKENDIAGWTVTPRVVKSLTKETLVPRGGAYLDFQDRSVLLVGCGSIGSEISHRLAASGIGALTISDADLFGEENLYRHSLDIRDIGYPKCSAVALDIRLKCPWTTVEPWTKRLEELYDGQLLKQFDLIVIAIGSPTVERAFHDFIQQSPINLPIVNVWVEAYGIGGHATLDIPDAPGCLKCAYVDPESLGRGLASNLNFLQQNQDVTRAHAGCGDLFLPYSSVAASYTATMAADIVIKNLLGQLTHSSKISWKGSAEEAERNGLTLTHRYHHFSQSMQILPLLNEHCDVCAR